MATTTGSDPFTFNAILGAWFRPVPFLQFGVAGQVVPANIETNSTLRSTPLDPTLGAVELDARRHPRERRQRHPAAAADARGWARATAAWPGRARSSTSSWTSSTRPGRASTTSRVETHGLVADFQGGTADLNDDHDRQALAQHAGGEAGRRRRRDPGSAGAARRRVLRDGRRRRRLRQRRLRGRADDGRQPRRLAAGSGAWRWRSPTSCATCRASASPRTNGRVYQQVPASACQPPYTDPNTCNEHYLGQPAPVVNAGTLQRDVPLHCARAALPVRSVREIHVQGAPCNGLDLEWFAAGAGAIARRDGGRRARRRAPLPALGGRRPGAGARTRRCTCCCRRRC